MSLEDLRNMGLLRDEREWTGDRLASRVHLAIMVPAAALGLAGCAVMAAGDGGWVTWVGIASFLVGLFLFIAVNLRGVARGRSGRRTSRRDPAG